MLVYPSLSSCLLVLLVTSSFLLQKRHGKEIKQNENEMHFRKLVDEDRNFRLVISLTTSPQRLIQMENSFNSLLSQTRLPDRIYFNLPHIFKRTNDTLLKIHFLLLWSIVEPKDS